MPSFLSRNVLVLSVVSLSMDMASEMLYPVMPLYLKDLGFSMLLIGVLEGLAEAVAGLSKGFFGQWSDGMGRRLPFVQWGYLFSALSKPMMAMFSWIPWIFAARTLDRLGKGLRSGARDALLADESDAEHRGKVFGFHRAMDTVGAAIGPLMALAFLYVYPGNYKTLFYLAFIPALLGVFFTFLVKEKKKENSKTEAAIGFFSYLAYWKKAEPAYKQTITALLLFTLANSSDAFLLLLIKQKGYSDQTLLLIYVFYNLCYALLAYPAGRLGDRYGLKNNLLMGLCIFALVYLGISSSQGLPSLLFFFFLYGAYAALSDSGAKALITLQCKAEHRATALGFYSSFSSIFLMLASVLAGLLWQNFGPSLTFACSAALALLAAYLLYRSK